MASGATAKKKIALNIYLLKRKLAGATSSDWADDELLNKTEVARGKTVPIKFDRYSLGPKGEFGVLYIRKPLSESVPEWVNLVADALPKPDLVKKLKNKSVSALLVKKVKNRQFAIAFGHGRHMLDPSRVEHRFGIKVALNSIESNNIASIDRQTFDATPKLTRTQTVKPSAISDYGINTEQDLLRGVVGKVKSQYESELGTVIAGMDSLKTALAISLQDIDLVLETALSRSESKDYLKNIGGRTSPFAWVDNLQAVSDPTIVKELDDALWNAFDKNDFAAMWLAIPEIVNWEEVSGFAYTNQQVRDNESVNILDIVGMKATLAPDATLKTLKQRPIYMVMAADGTAKPFAIYKCLYAEIKIKAGAPLHILNAGNWYQVEPSFEKSVNNHFLHLPRMSFATPFIPYDHKNEGAYNKAVCAHSSSGYKLLDRKLIQFGGGHSSIEVCDLYLAKTSKADLGHLVHVKRGRDSASLSHLFAQGLVSCTLLASEANFVQQVNLQLAKQGATALPLKIPSAEYDVIFAIIDGDAKKALDIPFFSKVSLQNSVRSIKALGFGVKLLHIPESTSFISGRKIAKAAKKAAKPAGKKSSSSMSAIAAVVGAK